MERIFTPRAQVLYLFIFTGLFKLPDEVNSGLNGLLTDEDVESNALILKVFLSILSSFSTFS